MEVLGDFLIEKLVAPVGPFARMHVMPVDSALKPAAIFSDDGQAVQAFRTNSLRLSFMSCSRCTLQRVEPFRCCGAILRKPLEGRTKGERQWLRRSAQPSWLHLRLSLLHPLHRLQRPKKASPTNKARPHNVDPTRRTSRLSYTVRAAISKAVRYTKGQKQENIIAIRQRIAEMR
jgi:hypothetical protein